MRVCRYRVFDSVLVSGTGVATSNSVSIDPSNGYFSLSGSVATAGATAKVTYYYQLSEDDVNWSGNGLATEMAVAGTFFQGIDPPVARYMRIIAVGTSDNSSSNRVTTKLLFTEDEMV